jgi:hypothetical protein
MRNFKKSPIILSILYILLNTACKKSEVQQLTKGFNVYMAGTENGNAVFWKNGQGTALANGSDATGIAVSEPDVFVSGQSDSRAAYWKNGQLNLLTQAPATVNGITLSGSDVYSVGEVPGSSYIDSAGGSNVNDNSAVYWVNGTMHNLEPDSRQAAAEGIAFAGSDMYVVGHVFNSADTAVQWKNGIRSSYTNDNGQNRIAYSVAVSGADVYAAGSFNTSPVYWKNGVITMLNTSISGERNGGGYAKSVMLAGTDVYVVGAYDSLGGILTAAYWKNGVLIPLQNNSANSSLANGIALAGNDIYIVGAIISSDRSSSSPAYWKNGALVNLSGNGEIKSVYVTTQ